MTEGLIADLAEIGSLKVISRSSGAVAEGKARSLAELAGELGVEAVVKGSIRRAGDSVRVNVRFLQAPDSTLLLAENIRAASASCRTCSGRSPRHQRLDRRELEERRAEPPQMRAARWINGPTTPIFAAASIWSAASSSRRGHSSSRPAASRPIGRRPTSAWPITTLPFPSSPTCRRRRCCPRPGRRWSSALELDETLAEAHAANAYIRAYYEWDWRAAEQEFRRALELRPNYADAYFSYSRFLASRGRLDEAIAQLGRAVELDPLSLSLHANRALLDYFAGRYDEAERRLREVLAERLHGRAGQVGAGARGRTAGESRRGHRDTGADQRRQPQPQVVARPCLRGRRQDRAGAAVLATLGGRGTKYVPSYWFALVHAGLGEHDQALRYLERAYEERSTVLAYLLIDPRLAPLKDDPRFLALAQRLGGR